MRRWVGPGANRRLREWLATQGHFISGALKPGRPKEAMRQAMRVVRKAPSAAVYNEIARTVGIKRCQDAKFHRLVSLLRTWFPQGSAPG